MHTEKQRKRAVQEILLPVLRNLGAGNQRSAYFMRGVRTGNDLCGIRDKPPDFLRGLLLCSFVSGNKFAASHALDFLIGIVLLPEGVCLDKAGFCTGAELLFYNVRII